MTVRKWIGILYDKRQIDGGILFNVNDDHSLLQHD